MSRGTYFPLLPAEWCCYLLVCADGSYYCGLASNLNQRIRQHANGRGTGYTKRRKPTALVWFESHPDRASAAARERQIKNWGHAKKAGLANGEPQYNGLGQRVWVSLVPAPKSSGRVSV